MSTGIRRNGFLQAGAMAPRFAVQGSDGVQTIVQDHGFDRVPVSARLAEVLP